MALEDKNKLEKTVKDLEKAHQLSLSQNIENVKKDLAKQNEEKIKK